MDKRKYETKTLIAEYYNLSKLEDCRFSENAYELKDGSKIIEYDGNGLSIYGTYIAFGKSIGRKGIYSIKDEDYKIWKAIRKESKDGCFVDWEEEINEQLEETWQEQYNNKISLEHLNVLESITTDDLPF
ncbi:hypothetical protein GKZ28_14070 [Clostridium chromiireducens]|uniref:Uncharacterized protein n=1 Tax=Clostridium chromiireducens TaxID=225345 RepID=A0A964W2S8_9CLOT|nr:hypothetical protein [Clostridium chromiireducens]MVX64821.1 hypothetical protein [Clostridium chromiireducens]